MPLRPGDVVDRYVIEALLGAGGMGEVYRAQDVRLHRGVALKVLRDVPDAEPGSGEASSSSTGGAERLIREARAVATLEHPNVVGVYDVGRAAAPSSTGDVTYLAMELIKGASLRAYVGDARVSMTERVRWLADVARALAAAHRAGLVHRDVKPENVMVREDGVVKVLDFGIARRTKPVIDSSLGATEQLTTMTAQGLVMGTPLYMAPEQLRAERLDGRADQFSWGVVAFELLSGKLPWSTSGGGIALMAQILSAPAPSLATFADVPEHVARTIARALQKDPAARFESMDVLVEALAGKVDAFAATLSGIPAVAQLTPPPPPPPPTSRSAGSGGTDAFASAPTEAVVTPPVSRKPPESTTVPRARSPARGWVGAALAGLMLLGATGAVTMKLRAKAEPTHPGVAASASAARCSSNEACIQAHDGGAWICRAEDHQCASLASADCSVAAEPGDVALDTTVWLGSLTPLTGDDAFKENAQTVELARRDFAETLGRIGSARHIGVLSCDSNADLSRAAHHLADDVHVPAVILGTTDAAEIVETAARILAPRDVLSMVTFSTSPLVTALPQGPSGRLVYRSTFSADHLLRPTTAFVESVLEPRVAAHGARHQRVAFLHERTLAANAFYDRLLSSLRFNGKSVIDNGDDFRDVAYEDDPASYQRAESVLVAFRPDIVLARLSPGSVAGVLAPLEAQWPAGTPRPFVVLPFSFSQALLEFVAGDASRRQRFFGMDSVLATAANVQFVNHYNQTYDEHAGRSELPGTSFDGFYALAYAVEALGDAPVTGPSIAGAFGRLAGPGHTFLVGARSIFDAYGELRSGGTIDLEGTSGHLDLSAASGESTCGIAILCAAPRERGTPERAVESGLVYDEARGLTGSLTCP